MSYLLNLFYPGDLDRLPRSRRDDQRFLTPAEKGCEGKGQARRCVPLLFGSHAPLMRCLAGNNGSVRVRRPIFGDPDPFTIRFIVKPIVILDPELAIPIFDPSTWERLSMTRPHERGGSAWTGHFRASLNLIDDIDGEFLMSRLLAQDQQKLRYPLTARDRRQLARKLTVRTLDGEVTVEVPDDESETADEVEADGAAQAEIRQSTQIQAQIAQIGAEMDFRIWVPKNDRAQVLEHVSARCQNAFLET